ncbi:MAG: iron-containing redox enzyme family protein, partial [Waterburya sp.]
LHIKEDERHGQWMLHQVALPLVDMYPQQAWELLLGYDQEKLMSDRAGAAVIQAVKLAENFNN